MEFSDGFKNFWNINPDYLWWIALFYTPLVSVPLTMSIPDKKKEESGKS